MEKRFIKWQKPERLFIITPGQNKKPHCHKGEGQRDFYKRFLGKYEYHCF